MNPFGGKKSATKIFSEDVKPYLEDADIQITLIGLGLIILFVLNLNPCFYLALNFDYCLNFSETKHQLHAKDVAKNLDLSMYDGIVCVSGDGILVEVSFDCLNIAFLFLNFVAFFYLSQYCCNSLVGSEWIT